MNSSLIAIKKICTNLTTICVNVRDRVCCLSVCPLSPPGPVEVWKNEWYHVVTNCQGHVLSPSGLPKVAKNVKKPKVDFCTNCYTGSDDSSSDDMGIGYR